MLPVTTTSQRWAALRNRDPSANSAFMYGVTSTFIFCRPTCPGRLARRSNVVFFDDMQKAFQAGYRPCKRCDPCNDSWHGGLQSETNMEQAQHLIAKAVIDGESWTVTAVADEMGISAGHLHRLFKRHLNTTPKGFAENLRMAQKTISSDGVRSANTLSDQHLFSPATDSWPASAWDVDSCLDPDYPYIGLIDDQNNFGSSKLPVWHSS